MFTRFLDRYIEALKSFEAGVNYDYFSLVALPNCPQFTKVAPRGPVASSTNAGAREPPVTSSQSVGNVVKSTAQHQQRTVELLQKRQLELRTAAAQAKGKGDMGLAKTYLRESMGMQNMIRAAAAGLAIDLKQLPKAPGARKPDNYNSNEPVLSGRACPAPVDFQTELIDAKSESQDCSDTCMHAPHQKRHLNCVISF